MADVEAPEETSGWGDVQDRSPSPVAQPRNRSLSPRREEYRPRDSYDSRPKYGGRDQNVGTNLFVSGLAPSLNEDQLQDMFEKHGPVQRVQIMRDPHTKDSRGFGFVEMRETDHADSAMSALTGEQIDGRTLTVEKARRSRPRSPTPGKYFGQTSDRDGPRGGRGPPRGYGSGNTYRPSYDRGGPRDRYSDRGPPRDRYDDRPPRRGRYDSYSRDDRPPRDDRPYRDDRRDRYRDDDRFSDFRDERPRRPRDDDRR